MVSRSRLPQVAAHMEYRGKRMKLKGTRDLVCVSWTLPQVVQALDDVTSALRDSIEGEDAVVRQRPLPGWGP